MLKRLRGCAIALAILATHISVAPSQAVEQPASAMSPTIISDEPLFDNAGILSADYVRLHVSKLPAAAQERSVIQATQSLQEIPTDHLIGDAAANPSAKTTPPQAPTMFVGDDVDPAVQEIEAALTPTHDAGSAGGVRFDTRPVNAGTVAKCGCACGAASDGIGCSGGCHGCASRCCDCCGHAGHCGCGILRGAAGLICGLKHKIGSHLCCSSWDGCRVEECVEASCGCADTCTETSDADYDSGWEVVYEPTCDPGWYRCDAAGRIKHCESACHIKHCVADKISCGVQGLLARLAHGIQQLGSCCHSHRSCHGVVVDDCPPPVDCGYSSVPMDSGYTTPVPVSLGNGCAAKAANRVRR